MTKERGPEQPIKGIKHSGRSAGERARVIGRTTQDAKQHPAVEGESGLETYIKNKYPERFRPRIKLPEFPQPASSDTATVEDSRGDEGVDEVPLIQTLESIGEDAFDEDDTTAGKLNPTSRAAQVRAPKRMPRT